MLGSGLFFASHACDRCHRAYLPSAMEPLRTTQLKGLGGGGPPSAATAGGSTGAHTNSYVMLVGLRIKKRLVLRTLMPSDSNSNTCKSAQHAMVGWQTVGPGNVHVQLGGE